MSLRVCRANLLALATAYGRASEMSLHQVSKKFYGRGGWISGFAAGKNSISMDKYYSVVDAILADWPADAEWPILRAAVITKPKPKKTAPRRKIVPREIAAPLS